MNLAHRVPDHYLLACCIRYRLGLWSCFWGDGLNEAHDAEGEVWKKAESWRAAALASGICVIASGLFLGIPYVLETAETQERLWRTQICGGFFALGLAVVTFCTVVWRGLISTEQARLQAAQLNKLAEQVAATDRTNTAQLLQQGAELLAEHDKPPKITAGLAFLQIVAKGPDGAFAIEAMNVLADFITNYPKGAYDPQIWKSSVQGLREASLITGRHSSRRVEVRGDALIEISDEAEGPLIVGAASAKYIGAQLVGVDLRGAKQDVFEDCTFHSCNIDLRKRQYFRCNFQRCTMDSYGFESGDSTFFRCDFSRARFSFWVPDLRKGDNYYQPGSEPVALRGIDDWQNYLHHGEPEEEIPF